MIRIIIIIAVILLSIPLIEKGKDYFNKNVRKAKVIGETTKKAIKYSESDLAETLERAYETSNKDDFVNDYLSGVAKQLINKPELYRSFGAYWWPLKEFGNLYHFHLLGQLKTNPFHLLIIQSS